MLLLLFIAVQSMVHGNMGLDYLGIQGQPSLESTGQPLVDLDPLMVAAGSVQDDWVGCVCQLSTNPGLLWPYGLCSHD